MMALREQGEIDHADRMSGEQFIPPFYLHDSIHQMLQPGKLIRGVDRLADRSGWRAEADLAQAEEGLSQRAYLSHFDDLLIRRTFFETLDRHKSSKKANRGLLE
jgi:hypothetical protein